jgi:hypothetical protein
MGNEDQAYTPPPLTEEQCRALVRGESFMDIPFTDEQKKWLYSHKPVLSESWKRAFERLIGRPNLRQKLADAEAAVEQSARGLYGGDSSGYFKWLAAWRGWRAALARGQVVVGGIQSEHRVLSDTELAEVAAEVVKALRPPRRKRAPGPTTKTARARKLAEQLYPNGVGAVGEKNQKAIRSTFCDAYRERYGEGLSDTSAWRALAWLIARSFQVIS